MTMPTILDLWSFLTSLHVELLGWTLLHFVWQGALVAALLAGVMYVLRNHSPRVRYAVSCMALLGLFALPVGTGLLLSDRVSMTASSSPASVESLDISSVGVSPVPPATVEAEVTRSWRAWATERLRPATPWIALGWGVGVLLFSIRLVGGAWRVRRLHRTSRAAPDEWQSRLQMLAERMGLRHRVVLRQSPRVDSPMAAGWWRSVILVPAGLLSGLPPKQVEAVLLHELAHIRRHDVLVARLQAVVETLLFFHPAAWWISKQVRQAREACCDDVAVRSGTERTVYARALAALAEQAVSRSPSAWTPAASDGSLLARVRRLLSPTPSPSRYVQRLSMTIAVFVMAAVPIGLAACASQQSVPESDSQQTAPTVRQETEESAEKDTPATPEAPPAEAERAKIVVTEDDSTQHGGHTGADDSVDLGHLEEGIYVFRHEGRVDTVDLPMLEHLERDLALDFDPDSLEQALRMEIDPDSLERVLRARINPDSIERVVRTRFDPDSLEQRALRMHAHFDSLARQHHEHADSLRQRMEREMPEHLREQARRLREQALRLEERAEEMEGPNPPPSPPGPDSGGD